MKFRTLIGPAAAAALALGAAPAFAAPVLIDSFTTEQSFSVTGDAPQMQTDGVSGSESAMIGGARLARIQITGGTGTAGFDVNNVNTIGKSAEFSNTFGSISNLLLAYNGSSNPADIGNHDGLSGTAGGCRDLTDGGSNDTFQVNYASDLAASGTVTIYNCDGTDSVMRSWDFTGGSTNEVANLTFESFTGDQSIFSSVGAINVGVNVDGQAFDGMISLLTTTGVPEPGTLTLLGFGLLGAGYLRKRKKQA